MSNKAVLYRKKDHIGYITLHRPQAGNAVSEQMAQELDAICCRINGDSDIYVVLLTAAGDKFCTGREEISGQSSPSRSIAAIEQPVVVAINGDAVGEGLEIALSGDIRLAAEGARFGLPQVAGGLIPENGGTQRLPRIVGKAKALELILTGEIIDAREARQIGLVSRAVPAAELLSEAQSMVEKIAAKAPIAMRYAKEAVNKGLELTMEQGIRLEADLYFLIHTTADRTEGVTAFLEKRPPQFRGQ